MFVVDDKKQRKKMTEEFYANYKRDIEFYRKRIQNFIEKAPCIIEAFRKNGVFCIDEELAYIYQEWISENHFDN